MILLRRCVLGRRRHIAHFHVSPPWWTARKVLQRFKLADIGEGITECEVIKWYVSFRKISLLSSYVVYGVLCGCATRSAKMNKRVLDCIPLNHPTSSLYHLTHTLLVYIGVYPPSPLSAPSSHSVRYRATKPASRSLVLTTVPSRRSSFKKGRLPK